MCYTIVPFFCASLSTAMQAHSGGSGTCYSFQALTGLADKGQTAMLASAIEGSRPRNLGIDLIAGGEARSRGMNFPRSILAVDDTALDRLVQLTLTVHLTEELDSLHSRVVVICQRFSRCLKCCQMLWHYRTRSGPHPVMFQLKGAPVSSALQSVSF